ncbi:conserved hypothetical protein [Streptomyces misionensis JCM 4497]
MGAAAPPGRRRGVHRPAGRGGGARRPDAADPARPPHPTPPLTRARPPRSTAVWPPSGARASRPRRSASGRPPQWPETAPGASSPEQPAWHGTLAATYPNAEEQRHGDPARSRSSPDAAVLDRQGRPRRGARRRGHRLRQPVGLRTGPVTRARHPGAVRHRRPALARRVPLGGRAAGHPHPGRGGHPAGRAGHQCADRAAAPALPAGQGAGLAGRGERRPGAGGPGHRLVAGRVRGRGRTAVRGARRGAGRDHRRVPRGVGPGPGGPRRPPDEDRPGRGGAQARAADPDPAGRGQPPGLAAAGGPGRRLAAGERGGRAGRGGLAAAAGAGRGAGAYGADPHGAAGEHHASAEALRGRRPAAVPGQHRPDRAGPGGARGDRPGRDPDRSPGHRAGRGGADGRRRRGLREGAGGRSLRPPARALAVSPGEPRSPVGRPVSPPGVRPGRSRRRRRPGRGWSRRSRRRGGA